MGDDAPVCVVTHPVFPATRRRLEPHCRLIVNESLEPWSLERLREWLGPARAAMTFMPDRVDDTWLAAAPHLAIVAGALKGYDNIDVAAATSRGVWVSIVPDHLTVPTAELAIALLLGLARHVRDGDEWVRSGAFRGWRSHFYGMGLSEATVGLVGYGRVGRAIAVRLAGFGCTLLANDVNPLPGADDRWPAVEAVDLDALLARSDAVVLSAPLTPATQEIIGAAALAQMRRGALLVNIARGSLVDEAAVADALAAGRLGGFAADVFAFEDWARADRPRAVHPGLLAPGRATLFTPHLGSATRSARQHIELAAADNIIEALSGRRPPDAINDVRVV